MDQARSTISKIFNGEPRSYTRFNLTQNMEGDSSQVEMKLSSDTDEEVGGACAGEHRAPHSNGRSPYVARKPGHTARSLCFAAVATLLLFVIGYMIGYLVHRKNDLAPNCSASTLPSDTSDYQAVVRETGAAPLMNWADVKSLLAEKLSKPSFDKAFSDFSSPSHQAGSQGDEHLGNMVAQKFKEYGMKGWTNEHFVRVQEAPSSGTNRVAFMGNEWHPRGFLSYSANGVVTGPVLYAYYGQDSHFRTIQDRKIDISGRVVLVRAGRISLAEKVANAARRNASAVLIFPDFSTREDDHTELFGHVHLGSGDPYTPGFPSFNHTQFPPVQSSGLPSILAQTITASMAKDILKNLGGMSVPPEWGGVNKLGDQANNITVQVDNVQAERKIVNVFGVIKGFVDQDRYVVLGAQRDAWGPGFARSTVGTSVLVELARAISWMVEHGGFRPRRSIVFASWSAGEYGSVGATEWLEGYLSSLSMKAFSYINLDGIVTGMESFKVAASPLLQSLMISTLQEVKIENQEKSLYEQYGKDKAIMESMQMDDAAYPFLAFSGIPSVSFRFTTNAGYQYLGTELDTRKKLDSVTSNQVARFAMAAAKVAGQAALRLVHDHLLRFDLRKYHLLISTQLNEINKKVKAVQSLQNQVLPKSLTVKWLMEASGSYGRASRALATVIQDSDLEDVEMCRSINDRLMMVERSLLSPYVSPIDTPFRHILLGTGKHTLKALHDHLEAIKASMPEADADVFRNQFALATWTIQGCANSLAGDIWALDNDI